MIEKLTGSRDKIYFCQNCGTNLITRDILVNDLYQEEFQIMSSDLLENKNTLEKKKQTKKKKNSQIKMFWSG